jgi:glutaredoxin 3
MQPPTATIYVKPWCPYCHRAKSLLSRKGVAIEEIDVSDDPVREAEMIERARGRRTVPQIFLGTRHVGGCDDLLALEARGELDRVLLEEGFGREESGREGAHT